MISSTISLLPWQHLSFWSSLSTLGTNFAQIFRIFSSSRIIVCTVPTLTSNCALIVSIDTRRSLSMKFFIWPINSGVLTSLLLHTSHHPSQTPCLLWISYATQKLMLDSYKMVQKQSEAFLTFLWHFSKFKIEFFFIAYCSSNVSSHPDCIFEIHQPWQSLVGCIPIAAVAVHLNLKSKIGQLSHKMYRNKILNFQESTTILNACTKKSGNLLKA